ncbi:MAG: hypothetical protein IPK68_15615 [Bdellovibrionales bacterium]|nr:hypothetical protein [Bdellovibrionales bacterium]
MIAWRFILSCMIISLSLSGCSDSTTGTSVPVPKPVSVHSEAVDASDKFAPLDRLLEVGCRYQIIDGRRGDLSCQEKATPIDGYNQYKSIAQFYHSVGVLIEEKSHHHEVREKLIFKHGAAMVFLLGKGKVDWADYVARRSDILFAAKDIAHSQLSQVSHLQKKENLLESGMWILLRSIAVYAQVYLNFDHDQVNLEVGKIFNLETFLSYMEFFKAELDELHTGSQGLCHQVFETLNQLGSNQ